VYAHWSHPSQPQIPEEGQLMMRPGQREPNEFELAILERMAAEHPSLHAHLGSLHVLSREFTGVGSFTNFLYEDSELEISEQQISLNGLIVMPNVPNGMGAVLFCRGDRPQCLETFTYGDNWDGVFDNFSIDEII
jgi:hypothetical protein